MLVDAENPPRITPTPGQGILEYQIYGDDGQKISAAPITNLFYPGPTCSAYDLEMTLDLLEASKVPFMFLRTSEEESSICATAWISISNGATINLYPMSIIVNRTSQTNLVTYLTPNGFCTNVIGYNSFGLANKTQTARFQSNELTYILEKELTTSGSGNPRLMPILDS